jgi:hypothetical protein
MSDMNRSFSGSMPEFYDRFLVPLQFGQFAQDLAEWLRTMTSGQLLEIAAGTGIVTSAPRPWSKDLTFARAVSIRGLYQHLMTATH